MSIKTNIAINEGSDFGFKAIVRDTNSDIVVPSSMNYYLLDSRNTIITSGIPIALSSETLITISNSYTLVQSGESRTDLKRLVAIKARYLSGELGANTVENEVFEFTLVNNPLV